MNAKKMLIGLSTVLILSSVAIAQPGQGCGMNGNCPNMQNCPNGMQGKQGGMKTFKHQRKGGHFIGAIMRLNLTDQQRMQIRDIMRSQMQNRVRLSEAFSDTGFDKALFIKLSEQRKANKIQRRADRIEAIYNVLTPEQKKELKQMLNQRMTNRMGKNQIQIERAPQ